MPYAALPHGNVHYDLGGKKSGPVLVLCHALGTDLTLWDRQREALGKSFRLLRYDLRGHGYSAGPDTEYTVAELAGDLLALLDVLEVDRAHLCGLSIGGLVAMQAALAAPARVGRLVLANTAARIGTAESWRERIAQVRKEGLTTLADAAIQRWFTPAFQAQEPALMAQFRALILQTRPHAYVGCCAALRDADLRGEVLRIASPTLVIGAAHDPVTTPAHGHALAEAIPAARYLELSAAHLSSVEAHDAFAAALREFLA